MPVGATSKHTGVLYFHGIGEQRGYEEVSRLIDALGNYGRKTRGEESFGRIPGHW